MIATDALVGCLRLSSLSHLKTLKAKQNIMAGYVGLVDEGMVSD